jgi:translocation and assembly module TamA
MLAGMRAPRLVTGILCSCLLPWATALARVEIEGVRGALRDNVLAHLRLDDAPCDAPSWRVRRLSLQAEQQIRDALEAYGYYNPVIAVRNASEDGCWLAEISIDPGAPVRLRRVDVTVSGEAEQDEAFRRLLDAKPLRAGDVLNHAAYEKHKRSFTDLARQRGYFAGRFETARLDVYAAQNAADITLQFDSGPRYRFGPVTFEQSVVRPSLVERFVDFRTGDPYDGVEVSDLYSALLSTGYFASVDLRTSPGVPPDIDVPVTIEMTPAKRQVYTAGVGYSTDTGPKLRAGYTNRRVNDRGHQFDATISLSTVLSEAGVSYRVPRKDPRAEWLSMDAGYQHEDTTTSRTDTYKIGIKETRRRTGDWIETRFVDASVEEFVIADDSTTEFLLVPGISWSHTFPSSTTVVRPDRGHRVSFRVSGTTEVIGSDSEFLQGDLRAKWILPVLKDTRLLLRGDAGATWKEELRTLPGSVRYFAGGDYSVRGYEYESLGTTDEEGNVVGGSHLLSGSVEIDRRVWRNWSAAAFFDAGNAFDNFAHPSLKTSFGAGIRWYSPLGPVRIDIAFPLDKNAPDDWRVHVTLGPDL